MLVSAKSLITTDKAQANDVETVDYFHILLDRHSLGLANGMWAESLYLGSECMKMLSPRNRVEIQNALPKVGFGLDSYGPKARPHLKVKEAELLN